MKPFIKWAGGKRWLVGSDKFTLPNFDGRYIEPFLGGGAVFFHLRPKEAILSDLNPKLVEVYVAVKENWQELLQILKEHQRFHSREYYYEERKRVRTGLVDRAAQFLYLNRTCWNGLYRENLKGEFNVPIGTKSKVVFEDEDFGHISSVLQGAEVSCCDFEITIDKARRGDLIFADPPYTTAHNMNGFVKYNQKIFSWDDQVRLKDAIDRAVRRGVNVVLTNADHISIHNLYSDMCTHKSINRSSIISGKRQFRKQTSEALYVFSELEGV